MTTGWVIVSVATRLIVWRPVPGISNSIVLGWAALGLGWVFENWIANRSVPRAGRVATSAVDVTRNGLMAATGGEEICDVSLIVAPVTGAMASSVAVAVTQSPVATTVGTLAENETGPPCAV